ncbi:hypothetical protein Hanom_Chr16g01463991 [Helianthus anomalus]
MVHLRHFESATIHKTWIRMCPSFGLFYNLKCTQGFHSFGLRRATKKILSTLPMSFHDWKGKFFYIKDVVFPVAMSVREVAKIPKETL